VDFFLAIVSLLLYVLFKSIEVIVIAISSILSPVLFVMMMMAWAGFTLLAVVYRRDPYKVWTEKKGCLDIVKKILVFLVGFSFAPVVYVCAFLLKIFQCVICAERNSDGCCGELRDSVESTLSLCFVCPFN